MKFFILATPQAPVTLEAALHWAKSGHESTKVYRYLFLHPDDIFTIPKGRAWSIAHQIVYHGDLALMQRVLALYYDDQINIRTPAADKERKTLLDVATERQNQSKDMYDYIKKLFLRDDLIRAARKNNWKLVEELLNQDPSLANEKPPYSTFFVLHYLVQNGDKKTLENFLHRFQFDVNVISADHETPLHLAQRLKRDELCAVLQSTTTKDQSDSDLTRDKFAELVIEPTPPVLGLPYPTVDQFPQPNLSTNSIVLTDTGSFQLQKKSPFAMPTCIPIASDQTSASSTTNAKRSERKDNPPSDSTSKSALEPPSTPATPASKQQLMKNLTCPLTQEIFVDPVIASDGQTYERAEIVKWIGKYECSPITGGHMDNKLIDNVELRQIIRSMQN